MKEAKFITNELEDLVEKGFMKKSVGEGTVYSVEDGKVVKKKVENCVTYESTGKSYICFK